MKIPTSGKAILKDGVVTPVDDLEEWAAWFETADRVVAKNKFGNVEVSTVFLGMDHGFGGESLWFETMIFGGEDNDECYRYETLQEAKDGHERAVAKVRKESSR